MKILHFMAFLAAGWLMAEMLPAVVISRQFDPPLGPNTMGYDIHGGPAFIYEGVIYTYDWIPFPLPIDFDGNGTTDVTLIRKRSESTIAASAIGGSQIWGRGGGVMGLDAGSVAAAFAPGQSIGPQLSSPNQWVGWHNDDSTGAPADLAGVIDDWIFGEFIDTDPLTWRYVGVKFERNGATHYGWVALNGYSRVGESIYVHGWAYESEPGVGLIAGQVPEPGSVFLLAGAGLGLAMRRRR